MDDDSVIAPPKASPAILLRCCRPQPGYRRSVLSEIVRVPASLIAPPYPHPPSKTPGPPTAALPDMVLSVMVAVAPGLIVDTAPLDKQASSR